jgi:hypothetical protein
MNKTIYIDIAHMNFWWGVYGFCNKTDWEDVIMYEQVNNEFEKITWTCICSRRYFENGFEDLENDPDEIDFVHKIREFLSSRDITYHYYYDRPADDDFYEVQYEAPRNIYGIKPRSIETWYPSADIGIEEVEGCTKEFCKKFLGNDVVEVKFKDIVSRKDALESYVEDMKLFNKHSGATFSEELIQQLEVEWNVSKEKVLEILNRSL